MKRETLTKSVAKALGAAGYKKPCCAVSLDGVKERRLPMGRIERRSRVKVRYWPEPTAQVLSFHPEEKGEAYYPLSELARLLELVETPDGAVRGRGIECAVKDGAAVITVSYTEYLREAEGRRPLMRELETRFEGR